MYDLLQLQRETESQQVFLIPITEEEAYIQVVGSTKLKLVKRAKVTKQIVDSMYEKFNSTKISLLGELDPVFIQIINEALDNKSCNIVSVPILTPENSCM